MAQLLLKFWHYQWQRFPIIVLLCTTTSVVVSSAGVQYVQISSNLYQFFVAIVVGILVLLNMRVLDDIRDFAHDQAHHKDRPVQAGHISIQELITINTVGLALLLLLLLTLGVVPLVFGLCTVGFSYFAGKDFFLGKKLKKHFLLYNCANFIQMLWVQLLVYAILDSRFILFTSVLWVHFLFAIGNAVIIEIVRKIKPPHRESDGKDTYSWRLGFRGALGLYTASCTVAFALYLWCASHIRDSIIPHIYTTTFLIGFLAFSIIAFDRHRTKAGEKMLEASGIALYLVLHISLYVW